MVRNVLLAKLIKTKRLIQAHKGAVVAFSGGVDSSLLLVLARAVLENNVVAVTVSAPINPPNELKTAKRIAQLLQCKHTIIRTGLLSNNLFSINARNRCYICKHIIFKKIQKMTNRSGYTVMEASNASDMTDYRPGLQACRELKILSPFIRAGLCKTEIRKLAYSYHLPNWDKPSSACLASRIPYGTRITRSILDRIFRAEQYLQNCGITHARVRDHTVIARIEVLPDDYQRVLDQHTKIVSYFRKLGYKYTVLDLEGYRTGSLN